MSTVILQHLGATSIVGADTSAGDVNELLRAWEDITSTPLQSDDKLCLDGGNTFGVCVFPSLPGINKLNVALEDGFSLDVTLDFGDGTGFATIGALVALPENVTLKLEQNSDEGETKTLSPIITINLWDQYGNIIAYESDDPLEICLPIDPTQSLEATTPGKTAVPGCYYYTQDGYWSEKGCTLDLSQECGMKCKCTHLTSFAALMRFVEQDKPYSRVVRAITYLGNGCSIFSLILGLISFSLLGWKESLHKERLFIHRQLILLVK
ncbi:adhesion G-protein coupled receptor D1-like [Amphiura filiformis]|uniref:adhesion G-protein coupled receptor D1-like n=1 Tax=Amphiura filiformis TaxID=82378 RepID=UPI003B2111B8